MLKLAEANRAIVAAKAYARDHGYLISVTVIDAMGHLIAHQRWTALFFFPATAPWGKLLQQPVLDFQAEKNLTWI